MSSDIANRCTEINSFNSKRCKHTATKQDDKYRPLCEVHFALWKRMNAKPLSAVQQKTHNKAELLRISRSLVELSARIGFLVDEMSVPPVTYVQFSSTPTVDDLLHR